MWDRMNSFRFERITPLCSVVDDFESQLDTNRNRIGRTFCVFSSIETSIFTFEYLELGNFKLRILFTFFSRITNAWKQKTRTDLWNVSVSTLRAYKIQFAVKPIRHAFSCAIRNHSELFIDKVCSVYLWRL